MTPFASAIKICGLSQLEAADFFGVRLDTVKKWCSERGRNPPPRGAWLDLAALFEQMSDAARGAADRVAITDDPRTWNAISVDLAAANLTALGPQRATEAMAILVAIAESESDVQVAIEPSGQMR